jgi:NTP pyrophosphatase (non-canonical NTP hydrolase)
MDLSKLMELVSEHWDWTLAKYYELEGADIRRADRFKRGHVLHHLQTEVGEIANLEERMAHRDSYLTLGKLEVAMAKVVAKLLIDVLQLANVLRLQPGVIEKALERTLRKHNRKKRRKK